MYREFGFLFVKFAFVVGLLLVAILCLFVSAAGAETAVRNQPATSLQNKKWIHGSADCEANKDPAIEVFQFDQASFILRQNKCLSFEAPFLYLLIGKEKVLVLDTGASKSESVFPLYETVHSLINAKSGVEKELLVVHSHSHSDHYSGDTQFEGKPNVTVIEPTFPALTGFFAFDAWPNGQAYLELGERKLTVIPTPGHQEEGISIYDPHTKWLLTGDTFYPGYIYVKNWDEYRKSIARLFAFSRTHDISAILGAHIEMTTQPYNYYEIGSVYQPDEASLTLVPGTLEALNATLEDSDVPQKIVLDELIVAPMNTFQITISNIARWLLQ